MPRPANGYVNAAGQSVPGTHDPISNQYGGTPDCIALINSKVSLVEFKTSAKPYADHLVAMAAHAALWNENSPGRLIEAFHWIGLPKDGSEFKHHSYADLSQQWEIFTLYLDARRLEKGLQRTRTKRAATIAQTPKAAPAITAAAPAKPRRARKPLIEQPAQRKEIGVRPQTMAQILRAYGHIKEAVPC
jgi:hypothetical protein